MSRNGSGVYSLPAGNPVTTGTTISSTWANTTLSDIATALTQSIAYNGVTTPIANLPMGGYKLTGLGVATTSGDALSYGNAITASSIVGTSVTDSSLTSGRVTYASTGGLLADSASLTFDGTNLGIANINGATLSLKTGGTTGLYIDASQNVGIGLTNPSSYSGSGNNLVVGKSTGDQGITVAPGSTNYGTLFFAKSSTAAEQYRGFIQYQMSTDSMQFGTVSAERMRIDSSGNVGIGTSSPAGKLHVNVGGGDWILGYGATYDNFYTCGSSGIQVFRSNATERMRIDSSGTLLIGQTGNPATSSVVIKVPTGTANGVNAQITSNTGTSYPWSNYNASGTYVGGISCTSSATAFPTSSDIRLKKNIIDAPSALEEIKATRVVSHEWIEEDTQPVEFGFIAQELIEVIPQAVIVGVDKEDGSIEIPWGVDYSKLVPLLTKAIQEQQAIITQLQADVAALKNGNTPSV